MIRCRTGPGDNRARPHSAAFCLTDSSNWRLMAPDLPLQVTLLSREDAGCAKQLGTPQLNNRNTPDRASIAVCMGAYLVVAVCVLAFDAARLPEGSSLAREGGGIEMISMLGYLVATVVYLWTARVPLWSVVAILLFMAARELDFDKALTSEGILSTKIFVRDTALWEKLLALGIWALLVATMVSLFRRRGAPMLRALRSGEAWAFAFVAGLALAVASKSIDGIARKLAPFGFQFEERTSEGFEVIEESLEILIPFFFTLAILLSARAVARRSGALR